MNKGIQEAGGSLDDFINRVRDAFYKQHHHDDLGTYVWVVDVFNDHVIVRSEDHYYRVDLMVTDDAVTFGDRVTWGEVKLDYVPASTAAETAESSAAARGGETAGGSAAAVEESLRLDVLLPLSEVHTEDDGTIGGVIVVEGKSANGNVYTAAALQSGVDIFADALMYADHPTRSEESQRPERSVRDVVGRVKEAYLGKTQDGKPALRGKFFISEAESAIKTKISEGILRDLSLRAFGQGKRDKGTSDFVVESFQRNPFTSVDVVTVAAAGGGFESLAESDRQVIRQAVLESLTPEQLKQARPDLTAQVVPTQAVSTQVATTQDVAEAETPAEVRPLKESDPPAGDTQANDVQLQEVMVERDRLLEENTRLFREVRTNQGEKALAEAVTKAGTLPKTTLQRITAQAQSLIEAFATHGSTQTAEDLAGAIGQVVETEKTYLAALVPNGAVTGLTRQGGDAPVEDILAEAFKDIVPPDQVAVAVRGRN